MSTRAGTIFGKALIVALSLIVLMTIAGIIRSVILQEPTLIILAGRWFFISLVMLGIVATLFSNRARLIAIEAALKDR